MSASPNSLLSNISGPVLEERKDSLKSVNRTFFFLSLFYVKINHLLVQLFLITLPRLPPLEGVWYQHAQSAAA